MESVLIVDDNVDLRELYSIVLGKCGYEIFTAPGGNECISLLSKKQPDLVLLDIMMEPMDGWETLDLIRSSQKTREIPVIMVTGKQPTREEIHQHFGTIDGYVIKPVTIHELAGLVKTFFQRRQRVNRGVQAFRESGANENLLAEYQQLCRVLAADSFPSKIMPELRQDIDQIMKKTRDRLDTIHHDCHFEEQVDVSDACRRL
jgi:CheY-like chemotaxis protein